MKEKQERKAKRTESIKSLKEQLKLKEQECKELKNLLKVKKSVRSSISEFYYDPNEFDKDRFLLYMDDGNMVYLTLTKFDMINYYNDVLSQLENKKGILYLDNGNHFQIME